MEGNETFFCHRFVEQMIQCFCLRRRSWRDSLGCPLQVLLRKSPSGIKSLSPWSDVCYFRHLLQVRVRDTLFYFLRTISCGEGENCLQEKATTHVTLRGDLCPGAAIVYDG